MAHYEANIAGHRLRHQVDRGSVEGGKTSGVKASVQTKAGSLITELQWHGNGKYDTAFLETHAGNSGHGERTLYRGPLTDLLKARTRTWTETDIGDCSNCGTYCSERIYTMRLLYTPASPEVMVKLCPDCIAELLADKVVICIPEGGDG